ncbi:hypothetical protein BZA70DRAFT_268219 [Myxozyma melibiosi]|uniref:Uncharacterized protein n=1 Tax=Myxozyma melibiosi TaxID=54550 RepID=A0ABR1F3E8_9ASCO
MYSTRRPIVRLRAVIECSCACRARFSSTRMASSSSSSATEAGLAKVLPSANFVAQIGRQFQPAIKPRAMQQDLSALVEVQDANTELEGLKARFGDGRRLVAYLRVLERGMQEETSAEKIKSASVAGMMATSALIQKITATGVVLGNQYALGRKCLGEVMSRDAETRARAREVLVKLRETNLPLAYFVCGNLFMSSEQYDRARAEYESGIRAAEAHVDASEADDAKFYDYDREADFSCMVQSHLMLGQLGERTKDVRLARRHYEAGLELRAVSGEKLAPLEVAAANYLSIVAEWEYNPRAMEHYGMKSAMAGNVYGILATVRVGKRFDEDSRWARKWQEVLTVQSMLASDMHLTLQSPELKPVYVTKALKGR